HDVLVQGGVADHAPVRRIRVREWGPMHRGEVDHVRERVRWPRLLVPPQFPLLNGNLTVQLVHVGERVRGDVDRPVIFPAPNDHLVPEHQERSGERHTVGLPAPGIGPAGIRTDPGATHAGADSAASWRSRVLIHDDCLLVYTAVVYSGRAAPRFAPSCGGGNKMTLIKRNGPSSSPGNGSSIGSKSRFTRSAVMRLLISCKTVSLVG